MQIRDGKKLDPGKKSRISNTANPHADPNPSFTEIGNKGENFCFIQSNASLQSFPFSSVAMGRGVMQGTFGCHGFKNFRQRSKIIWKE
jgi:hypothetical protein